LHLVGDGYVFLQVVEYTLRGDKLALITNDAGAGAAIAPC
jgi:hypothetical protein